MALELAENYFDSLTDHAMTLIRILYYPSQKGPLDDVTAGDRRAYRSRMLYNSLPR